MGVHSMVGAVVLAPTGGVAGVAIMACNAATMCVRLVRTRAIRDLNFILFWLMTSACWRP